MSWNTLPTSHKLLWALYAVAVMLTILDLSVHSTLDAPFLPQMEYIAPWWRMMQGLVLLALPLILARLCWHYYQKPKQF